MSSRKSAVLAAHSRPVSPGLPETNSSSPSASGVDRQAEPVGRIDRLAVLVEPDQRDVEGVARKIEIVGIAAERSGRLLRAEHQADVVIGAVFVQRVFAAGIERDDFAIAVLVALPALPVRYVRSRRRAPSGRLRRTGPLVALTSSAVTSVIATTISASRPGHCRSSAAVAASTGVMLRSCPGADRSWMQSSTQ